jgi:hypothetical protein
MSRKNEILGAIERMPAGTFHRFAEMTETPEGYYETFRKWDKGTLPGFRIVRNFSGDEISERFAIRADAVNDSRQEFDEAIHHATSQMPVDAVQFYTKSLAKQKVGIYPGGGMESFLRETATEEKAASLRSKIMDGYEEMLFWTAERQDFYHLRGYLEIVDDPAPAQSFLTTYFNSIRYCDGYTSESGLLHDTATIRNQDRIRKAVVNYGEDSHNRALQKKLLKDNTGIVGAGVIAIQGALNIGRMRHIDIALTPALQARRKPDTSTRLALQALHRTSIEEREITEENTPKLDS